jgi:transposase
MKAIHGGKAKNDRIDAHKIVVLLRGGMLPQAYVYPAGMRATRDLLRRRLHLVRKRGQLLAHIQNTHHAYNLPAFAKRLAYPSNRQGVAEHFEDRVVRKSIAVDLGLLERYDALITDLELYLVHQAKQQEPQGFQLLRSIPGVGKVLAMTILYEIHDIRRFGRVQEFASYARLVRCAKESAGKKHGTSGAKMGNVHLKWAFSEAAVLFVRHCAGGKRRLARWEKQHGKRKALSILAHKLGRAAYFMRVRHRAFDLGRFLATANG